MATKLDVFNEALRILAQPPLEVPDDSLEEGRQLNAAWDGAVGTAYESADWVWARKRKILDRSADVPPFGYQYYYELPEDFARMVQISSTGRPDDDEVLYAMEGQMIATDASAIYLVFISKELLIAPIEVWTQTFADLVGADLAVRTGPKLNPANLQLASQLYSQRKADATAQNAIKQPPARRRPGSFVRALRGYNSSREQG